MWRTKTFVSTFTQIITRTKLTKKIFIGSFKTPAGAEISIQPVSNKTDDFVKPTINDEFSALLGNSEQQQVKGVQNWRVIVDAESNTCLKSSGGSAPKTYHLIWLDTTDFTKCKCYQKGRRKLFQQLCATKNLKCKFVLERWVCAETSCRREANKNYSMFIGFSPSH